MCANCGFPATVGHWTEAGNDTSFDRMRARMRRIGVLRRVLAPVGLTADDDGQTPGVTISTRTGRHEMAEDLADVWAVVERMTGRPLDPLAPEFTEA